MLTDAIVVAVAVLALAGRWVWMKATGRKEVPPTPEEVAKAKAAEADSKRFHIWQGTAGMFVSEDLYKNPYTVEWEDVADYKQDRDGAEAYLTRMATKVEGDWFETQVADVTGSNDDGKSRQAIIGKLKPLDELDLEHEADDPNDKDIVRVFSEGHQIGLLESSLAEKTARAMDEDEEAAFTCFVLEVTGGEGQEAGVSAGILRWKLKEKAA